MLGCGATIDSIGVFAKSRIQGRRNMRIDKSHFGKIVLSPSPSSLKKADRTLSTAAADVACVVVVGFQAGNRWLVVGGSALGDAVFVVHAPRLRGPCVCSDPSRMDGTCLSGTKARLSGSGAGATVFEWAKRLEGSQSAQSAMRNGMLRAGRRAAAVLELSERVPRSAH